MKVLLVSDELVLDEIKGYVEQAIAFSDVFAFFKNEGIDEVLNNNKIDIAILDSNVTTLDYVELAKKVKISNKEANVIFMTEDEELYNSQNNGYILKPASVENISKAVEELVYPKKVRVNKTVEFICFGDFYALYKNAPIEFRYQKTTEFLAYLVDARGNACRMDEIEKNLFDGGNHAAYVKNLRTDLIKTLKDLKIENILINRWGKMAINKKNVDCDYFDWIDGIACGINLYKGDYMMQYEWSKDTRNSMERGRI